MPEDTTLTSFDLLKELLEEHSPREAATQYDLEGPGNWKETAEDFAMIIDKLLSGDLSISAEALESQIADQLDEISGSRLETLLDQKMRPDLEDGDYIVNVREVHEQMYLIRSDRADSLEEALSVKLGREESAIIYGLPNYEREIQDQEVVVEEVGGDSNMFDYSHSSSK